MQWIANDGNMKSWLCSYFQITANADSQFFILRVIGCPSLEIIKFETLKQQNEKYKRTIRRCL